jgi:hypothetical protein
METITDRDEAIKAVKRSWVAIKRLSDQLKDDDEIVSIAVSESGMALEYASPRLKDDEHIVSKAVQSNCSGPVPCFKRNDFADHLLDASPSLQDSEQNVTVTFPLLSALEDASPRLQDNDDIVTQAIKKNGYSLRYASPRLQDNDDIVTKAMQQNFKALQYASPRLQKILA